MKEALTQREYNIETSETPQQRETQHKEPMLHQSKLKINTHTQRTKETPRQKRTCVMVMKYNTKRYQLEPSKIKAGQRQYKPSRHNNNNKAIAGTNHAHQI